jgi:hypothetical protein
MFSPSRQLIHLYSAYMQIFIRPMFLAVDNYLLLAEFGKYSATPIQHEQMERWPMLSVTRLLGLQTVCGGECGVIECQHGGPERPLWWSSPKVAVAGLTEAAIPCSCV